MVKISDIIRGQDLFGDKKRKAKGRNQKDEVVISGILAADDIINDMISPSLRGPTNIEKKEALSILSGVSGSLDKMFSSIRKGKEFDIAPLKTQAKKLVKSFEKFENIYMIQIYNDYEDVSLTPKYNSLWTALIAIMIGSVLGLEREELTELALSALTHDVGMGLIDEDILNKKTDLLRSEIREIETHPEKGSELLKKFGDDYGYLFEVCAQEHEREDGSGYPNGLGAKDIHQYAKIISLADTYEAMTHDRPFRKRMLPLYAIKDIVENMKHKFNKNILKAFLEKVTLFPVGSYAKLNSKEVGRVIASTGETHFRQVVNILYGSDGKKLKTPRVVNLMEAPLLHIVEPVDEREF